MSKLWKKVSAFNKSIAVKSVLLISTMWCVYTFMLLTAIPLIFPQSSKVIQYISSAFLQLVFLPLIMVGQSVIGQREEKRSIEDHRMIIQELGEIKKIREELIELRKMLGKD